MVCPGVDRLEQYIAEQLDDDSSGWIKTHLLVCDPCKSVVTEIQENQRIEPLVRAVYESEPQDPTMLAKDGMIGQYRIVREIARGGTGVVFEAEQAHPQRRVALKLLHAPYAGDRRYERLLDRETRALARLKHPNIAAIYEAVPAGEGPAYFAMELVAGRSITAYAKAERLSIRQRVELSCKVCEAIAYAHGRGVIHRDLKPSNILVEHDGTPKVLDFGLAKILEPEASNTSGSTRSALSKIGRIAGTIPYMSPEQVRGNPEDVAAPSDVYALGVILYELLTEQMPYAIDPGNIPRTARTICEQPPTPPSRVAKALRGDLETIVLKSLEKDVERRYESAADFGADLKRFLRNEPILARPVTTWYQMCKFTRRNRALVASLGIAFVALIGGTAAALGQASVATRQRDIAERRLAHAEQTANYVFAGVGSQIGYVLGTGDIQRHLAEEAYVFYKRLADENPDDMKTQARLWAAVRRLATQALDVGDVDRALLLAKSARDMIEDAAAEYPENPLIQRELLNVHVTLAKLSADRGDQDAVLTHALRALQIYQQLASWYGGRGAAMDLNARIVLQDGPDAGATPAHVAVRRDWAFVVAGTLGPLLRTVDIDAAEEQFLEALAIIEDVKQIDPTLDPIYRDDISEYAQLAPPVLLRVGSRDWYTNAMVGAHNGLAAIAMERGDLARGEEHLEVSLRGAEDLIEQRPDEPATIALLATTYRYAAQFKLELGDSRAAQSYAEWATAAHRRLADADPRHVGWQRAVDEDETILRKVLDAERANP